MAILMKTTPATHRYDMRRYLFSTLCATGTTLNTNAPRAHVEDPDDLG